MAEAGPLGPYVNGLGKPKSGENSEPETEVTHNFFSKDLQTHDNRKRKTIHLDAELIPKFNPGPKCLTVKAWLNKIDQLGQIYNWNDADKAYIMHMRLRGSARDWYENLDDYALDWNGWKSALERAFPMAVDYVDTLELMLSRKKGESETMTAYFHDKLSLIKKCKIDEEGSVSCIIRGLPAELRANAKAFRCDTAGELYFGFLSSLENYRKVESAAARLAATDSGKTTWRRAALPAPVQAPSYKLCYVCRRPGHEGKDCRSLLFCTACQRRGHEAASCWSTATPKVMYNFK